MGLKMRLFVAFGTAFLVVRIITENGVVCRKLDTSEGTPQCKGQTLFIHGPKGEKGDIGARGGASNVKSRLKKLESQIEIFKNKFGLLQKAFTNHIRWYTPKNGYEYTLTHSSQSWNDSRNECKSFGAELAMFGVQDNATRRLIASGLGRTSHPQRAWIGLHDMDKDGVWQWINTNVANGNAHWCNNSEWNCDEPNNYGGNEYCGEMYLRGRGYSSNDCNCTKIIQGLCERELNAAKTDQGGDGYTDLEF